MSEDVALPGPRDVRGSLDGPGGGRGCVVACPPHPQFGGSRSNPVLKAVGEALAERGLATLRFDYGPWDEGEGEVGDAVRAAGWAAERFDAVGLFGYSFGATVALAAAAAVEAVGVSALAPASRLPSIDTLDALEAVGVPVQVLYGERDRTVDSTTVAERARELGHEADAVRGDHHFVGQRGKVAGRVAEFLGPLFG